MGIGEEMFWASRAGRNQTAANEWAQEAHDQTARANAAERTLASERRDYNELVDLLESERAEHQEALDKERKLANELIEILLDTHASHNVTRHALAKATGIEGCEPEQVLSESDRQRVYGENMASGRVELEDDFLGGSSLDRFPLRKIEAEHYKAIHEEREQERRKEEARRERERQEEEARQAAINAEREREEAERRRAWEAQSDGMAERIIALPYKKRQKAVANLETLCTEDNAPTPSEAEEATYTLLFHDSEWRRRLWSANVGDRDRINNRPWNRLRRRITWRKTWSFTLKLIKAALIVGLISLVVYLIADVIFTWP